MVFLRLRLFYWSHSTQNFFGENMGLKNIFGQIFWPIGQIFGQIPTSEIPKFEEILDKNSKIRLFFFKCGWRSAKISEYLKKNFSRSISLCKAHKLIFGSTMILNGQKWILNRVWIFFLWLKNAIFFVYCRIWSLLGDKMFFLHNFPIFSLDLMKLFTLTHFTNVKLA